MTPIEEAEEKKELFSVNSLSEKFTLNLSQRQPDLQDLINFNEKSAKWHTLNTLMIINNNKKIETLQNALDTERARLRFVEGKSEELDKQVNTLKFTLVEASEKLRNYHRNLMTVVTILKLTTTRRQSTVKKRLLSKLKEFWNSAAVGQIISHNALALLVSLAVSRVFWIDSIIDVLGKLLALSKLSKNSIHRTKIGMKISAIIFIFLMLRRRIQNLLKQFKAWVSFLV